MTEDLKGLRLNTEQIKAISRKMAEASREQSYLYPWASLEEVFKQKGLFKVPLVAYGSLLNSISARQTLSHDSVSTRRPVIAFGVRRLFNYRMPPSVERYGPPLGLSAHAALNVRLTGEFNDAVNGILIEASLKDIGSIRVREAGYDLLPIACIGWDTSEATPFIALILRCPDNLPDGRRLTGDRLEPHPGYYRVCREGASEFGEEFLHFWLATTYLADGITPVAEWEFKSQDSREARHKEK